MNAKIAVLKKIIVGFLVMVIGSGPYGYTMKRKRDEVSGQESSKRPRVTAPQASSSSQVGGQYVLIADTPGKRVALKYLFPHTEVKRQKTDEKSFFEMRDTKGTQYIALFDNEFVNKIHGRALNDQEVRRIFSTIHLGLALLVNKINGLVGVSEQADIDQVIRRFIQCWLEGKDLRVRLTLMYIIFNFNVSSRTPTLLAQAVWDALTTEEKNQHFATAGRLQQPLPSRSQPIHEG